MERINPNHPVTHTHTQTAPDTGSRRAPPAPTTTTQVYSPRSTRKRRAQHLSQASPFLCLTLPTEAAEWEMQTRGRGAGSTGSSQRPRSPWPEVQPSVPCPSLPAQETHVDVGVVDGDFQHGVVRGGVHVGEVVEGGRHGPVRPVSELPGQAPEPLLLDLTTEDVLQDLGQDEERLSAAEQGLEANRLDQPEAGWAQEIPPPRLGGDLPLRLAPWPLGPVFICGMRTQLAVLPISLGDVNTRDKRCEGSSQAAASGTIGLKRLTPAGAPVQ